MSLSPAGITGPGLIIASLVLCYFIKRGMEYRNAVKGLQNLPGHRIPIAPSSILGLIIRRVPGVCSVLKLTVGTNFVHDWGYDVYAQDNFGWDVRSVIYMFPSSSTFIFLADAAAIKEVTSSRARFPKAVVFYDVLSFFGKNIVASEGEEWKKYRKISAPAFAERNNKVVWHETTRIMNELFEQDAWKGKNEVVVDHVLDVILSISLFVIGCAGFGQTMSWDNDVTTAIPPGHRMSLKDVMKVLSKDFFIPIIVPKWLMGVSKRTKMAGLALVELRGYLLEMIQTRLCADKIERHDLFSLLLEENSHHMDAASLSDDELIGNMFLFYLGGHETISHTIAFALGLLALHQDEQDRLFQHIKTVLPDGRTPTYTDISSLSYTLAVFQETLRLFPPLSGVPKVSTEDTVLTLYNSAGEGKHIPVPKGTFTFVHVAALHRNPRYWKDPQAFKPSRFLEHDWPRDAFLPFSAGARACLGRRFAEIEAIVVLTAFISKYKVSVKEEQQFASETFEERKARVLACDTGLSLTPSRLPLVFNRR